MTREQHLQFCKVCTHKKFEPAQGIICGITERIADFQISCENYSEDAQLKKLDSKQQEKRVLNELSVGAGTRFLNYILDFLFIYALQIAIAFTIGVILALVSPETLTTFDFESRLFNYLLAFISGFIYYTTLEGLMGRSFGKLITGTKVIMENGSKVTFDAVVVRSLCRFIPFEQFSFLGDEARGWHDTISKTRVVKVNS